jgi:hypothetical protein
VDAGFANLGHGRRTSKLKLALLAKLGTTASRLTALVPSFTSNTLILTKRERARERKEESEKRDQSKNKARWRERESRRATRERESRHLVP